MEESKQGRRWNFVLLVAAGIAILAILSFALYSLSGSGGGSKPKPPKISLLPNTPPPPPPPPKEEKKPEPPKEQKEVRMEQLDQKQPPAPESEKMMDGPKGDAPSDFKAGAVTKEDYNAIKGESGNKFAFYSNLLQKFLQEELARNKALAGKEYRIGVMLWFDKSGRIEKINLVQSSGNSQTDTLIRNALNEMPPLKAPPPDTMPQPVRLRVTSRGAG